MTYRALLIGNSVFDADASLNPLNAPTKDVARLHRALVDSATGLFADEHVRLVVERTSDDLLDELDVFFSTVHREDLLLVYYSGHGLLDERNQLFLCGRNTRSDRLLRTAVSNVRINEFIDQSVARCTVIILDCCSSGMFKGGDVGVPLAGPGRYIVSSTRGSALANDAAAATGTSLFTEHLVTGLLGAAEDRDGDGFLDLREIYDYVRKQLTATTKQIPHSRFDGDGSVILAKCAAPAEDAVLAGEEVKQATGPVHPGDPSFVLSENMISLHDVDPHERLEPETVVIYPLGDRPVDCVAETQAHWLRAAVRGDRVVVELQPVTGHNRGKILIRDRSSGTAQVLRVYVFVTGSKPASTSLTETKKGERSVARASVPPPAGRETPVADPRPPRRRWIQLSALAGLVVLISAGVAYGLARNNGTDPGTPSLVGMNQADAVSKARKAGLTATVVISPAPLCEAGRVLAQSPSASAPVHVGSPVSLTVCGTLVPVPAPSLVGKTQPDAVAAVEGLQLTPRVIPVPSASTGAACIPGRVVTQSPAPLTLVAAGGTVAYGLCGGPASTPPKATEVKVRVPDLGSTRQSAEAALKRVGLHGKFDSRISSENVGQVLESTPGSGSRVTPGSTITVHLSGGRVTVPSVVGLPEDEAIKDLIGWNLNPDVVYKATGSVAPGTVIDSSPSKGEEVELDTTVRLTVATAADTPSAGS